MFATVTAEAGRLVDVNQAVVVRHDAGKTVTSAGRWGAADDELWAAFTRCP